VRIVRSYYAKGNTNEISPQNKIIFSSSSLDDDDDDAEPS